MRDKLISGWRIFFTGLEEYISQCYSDIKDSYTIYITGGSALYFHILYYVKKGKIQDIMLNF